VRVGFRGFELDGVCLLVELDGVCLLEVFERRGFGVDSV
jgi:hypothetical protein